MVTSSCFNRLVSSHEAKGRRPYSIGARKALVVWLAFAMLPVIVNTTAPVGAFMSTAEADSGKRHRQDSGNEDGGCLHELFLDRSTDYNARADAGQMHIIARHEAGLGDVAAEDLIKNYTLRMSRKGVPARAVYDALKILPRNNRCPFCNYGSVETLDHVLPKNISCLSGYHPHPLYVVCLLGLQARADAGALRRRSG